MENILKLMKLYAFRKQPDYDKFQIVRQGRQKEQQWQLKEGKRYDCMQILYHSDFIKKSMSTIEKLNIWDYLKSIIYNDLF